MKIRNFLSIVTIFTLNFVWAQPNFQWGKSFIGPNGSDKGVDIVTGTDGSTYVVASSSGLGTGLDILTIKYSISGDIIWTRRFNGTGNGNDEPLKMISDIYGNIYIVGKTKSMLNDFDIITIKYDQSGNILWEKLVNGTSNRDDIPNDMAVDKSGNVYIAINIYTSEYILKFNSVGVVLWYKLAPAKLIAINNNDGNIIGTSGIDYYNAYLVQALRSSDGSVFQEYNTHTTSFREGIPNSIVLDQAGNIYITSTSTDITSIKPTKVVTQKFVYPGTPNQKYGDWFSNTTSGSATNTGLKSLIDANLNVYVLSEYYTGTHRDYQIRKYSMKENLLKWKVQYNSLNKLDDFPVSMKINNKIEPDVYVTGYSNFGDINTIKIDAFGNILWEVKYDCGNNGADLVANMTIDSDDNLYLTGSSNCGNTLEDIKTIKYCNSAPSRPDYIIGKTEVCQKVSETYQVDPVKGALDYSWSLPDKWIILSGDRTNKITVIPGVSGNITVRANSALCSSLPQLINVSVYKIPTLTGKIIGDSMICDNNLHTYSIKPIIDAFEYVWILPNGSMTSQPSNEIEIDPKGASGILKVFARNICGNSDTLELKVKVGSLPSKPDAIIGNAKICPSTINNYKVKVIPGVTSYIWKKPSDWLFIGDSTSAEVNIACNQSSGEVSVAASSICGTSSLEKMQINVLSKLSVPGVIKGDTTICQGSMNLYSIEPVLNAESYKWVSPKGISDNNSTTNELITYADSLIGGDIFVTAKNLCFESEKQQINVALTDIDNTITVSGDTLIANDNNAAYQWIDCSLQQDVPGANSQSFKPIASGNYAVLLSKNNCTELSKCVLVTGQKDISELPKILIYPNPTNKLLNISIDVFNSQACTIELHDIFGKLMFSTEVKPNQNLIKFQIDIENYLDGVYLLSFNTQHFKYSTRILKQLKY